jgi:hypothetical protein
MIFEKLRNFLSRALIFFEKLRVLVRKTTYFLISCHHYQKKEK